MEPESNAMPQCRSGCGFYGNPSQDGLCSVCYKDFLRKKQQPPVSSTPSSNNGPQPPASGQSVTANAVSLRSVVVTQQSLANSISNASNSNNSSSSSTTTTTASSAAATSSSPSPSTCAAAANNPAVAVTNTAQPTVHSSLFCSDKDVKNKSPLGSETSTPSHARAVDEEEAFLGVAANNFDATPSPLQPPALLFDNEAQHLVRMKLERGISDGCCLPEFDSDCEEESDENDEQAAEESSDPASSDEDEEVEHVDDSSGAVSNPTGSTFHRYLESNHLQGTTSTCVRTSRSVVREESAVNARKRKLNTDDSGSLGGHSNNSSIADNDEKDGDKDDSKKKKNRCATCRKKVGLTGFECRCGGLFCAIHRYSDKHECSFDYRELGAAEIRRNNPVVVGEKIQKI